MLFMILSSIYNHNCQSHYSYMLQFDDHSQFDIQLIPQATEVSCWAASSAMIISSVKDTLYSDMDVVNILNSTNELTQTYALNKKISPDDKNMFQVLGLQTYEHKDFTYETIHSLLATHGPLWAVTDEDLYDIDIVIPHVRVIAGVTKDSLSDEALLTIYDPWDRCSSTFLENNKGSIYTETYAEFYSKMKHLMERENSDDAVYLAYPK